jgi:hypothetical protein
LTREESEPETLRLCLVPKIEEGKIGEGREAQVSIIFSSFGCNERVNGKIGSDVGPTQKTFHPLVKRKSLYHQFFFFSFFALAS